MKCSAIGVVLELACADQIGDSLQFNNQVPRTKKHRQEKLQDLHTNNTFAKHILCFQNRSTFLESGLIHTGYRNTSTWVSEEELRIK